MPDTQTLSTLQNTLRDLATSDLAAALVHLKEQLPEVSPKHAELLSILGRLNDANRNFRKGILTMDALQLEINRVRDAFLEFLNQLAPEDFDTSLKKNSAPGPKTGTVLYRIPHRMEAFKAIKCVVRVAIDEEVITDNMTVDADVQLRPRIEVSDAMDAALLDPSGGEHFEITTTSSTRQRVRDTGYTEWLFYVTPLQEGTYPLMIRVSMLEEVPGLGFIPKEISLEETVLVMTELPANEPEAVLKPAGSSFQLLSNTGNGANTGPSGTRGGLEGAAAGAEPEPDEVIVQPPPPPTPLPPVNRPAEALSIPVPNKAILMPQKAVEIADFPTDIPQSAPPKPKPLVSSPLIWILLALLLVSVLLYFLFI